MRIMVHAAFAIALLGLLALGGCGKDKDADSRVSGRDARTIRGEQPIDKFGHPKPERKISEQELDSLRVKKARHAITREEYWDGKGGVLANDYLEVWYPPGNVTVTHGMHAFDLIAGARKHFSHVFGRVPQERLTVKCAAWFDDYDDETGKQWWHYSKIDGDRIMFQPIGVLAQRKIAEIAVPHEYYEWGIQKLSGKRAPRWLEEGLSSVLSGESHILESQLIEFPGEPVRMDFAAIQDALKKETDRKSSRIAYYNAFRMVDKLIADHGRPKIVRAVLLMGEGRSAEEAFEQTYQQPYDELVASALAFSLEQ